MVDLKKGLRISSDAELTALGLTMQEYTAGPPYVIWVSQIGLTAASSEATVSWVNIAPEAGKKRLG